MKEAALIWDLDGTLLDSYGIIVSSLQQALAGEGPFGRKRRYTGLLSPILSVRLLKKQQKKNSCLPNRFERDIAN